MELPEALRAEPERLWVEHLAPLLAAAWRADPHLAERTAWVELSLRDSSRTPPVVRTWHLLLGSGELREGQAPHPELIVELDREDLVELLTGMIGYQAALIDGRLELSGDLGLIARLSEVF